MSANEHLEELLSGFLDEKLTPDELREVQSAMAADATLGQHVEQLKQIGNDLRSIPQRRLPRDFSQKVLAAIQVEAAIQVDAAGANRSSTVEYVTPVAEQKNPTSSAWRRTVAGFAAVAATLLFMAYMNGWFAGGVDSGFQGEQLVQGSGDVKAGELHANDSNRGASETWTNDSLANDLESALATGMDTKVDAGSIVRREVQRGSNELGVEFLTIIEVQPSVEAWNSNVITSVLSDAGIEWSSPVRASNDLVGALNDTRSISRGIPDGESDQVALVLVRASGVKVEKALMSLWSREREFPHIFIDLAFDIPGKDMIRKLTDAQRVAFSDSTSIATPIVVSSSNATSLANASEFSAAPTDRYVSKSARARPLEYGTGVTSADESELTYMLFVIRKPAE